MVLFFELFDKQQSEGENAPLGSEQVRIFPDVIVLSACSVPFLLVSNSAVSKSVDLYHGLFHFVLEYVANVPSSHEVLSDFHLVPKSVYNIHQLDFISLDIYILRQIRRLLIDDEEVTSLL